MEHIQKLLKSPHNVNTFRDLCKAFINKMKKYFLQALVLISIFTMCKADIVKPSLVEISVFADGHYSIEVRTSIEAMLTGINSKYKNTQDSPNAEKYDYYRVMESHELLNAFNGFRDTFTNSIQLKLDGKQIPLSISSVEIPEPGYTKVPRTSLIILQGKIDRSIKSISWYYPAAFSDNAVRVRQVDEENEQWHWSNWQWLRDDQWSKPFSLTEIFHEQSVWSVINTYTVAGFEHILPLGFDHILFILGIFLMSAHIRPILMQVTMFTIAHSITLSLAMLNIFSLPSNIVEPLIALSIAYVGIENIFMRKVKPQRLIIIFSFGLLHGMGFASMLADFGMPNNAFATALIFFNVGVELGQITIIALAFFSLTLWFRKKSWYKKVIVIPISALISIVGLYWTYDRIVF